MASKWKKHRSWKRRLRHWLTETRFRNQRKLVFVGCLVIIVGVLAASGVLFLSTSGWILIFLIVIVLIVWIFVQFFDNA